MLSILLVLPAGAQAAVPSAVYDSWVQGYVKRVDVEAELTYLKSGSESFCGAKSLAHLACRCEAKYQVKKIIRKPEGLDLNEGDTILLGYPCDKKKNLRSSGSTFPWIREENGGLIASLRSLYLEHKGKRRWELENGSHVFAPLVPAAAG